MIWLKRIGLLGLLAIASCATGVAKRHEQRMLASMPWKQQTPELPVQVATLWGDRTQGAFGGLVKLPGGFDSGLHAHTGDYHGVLIAGTWIHVEEGGRGADQELPPGSYVFQPGKGNHIDKCKPGAECILFIHQTEKADIIWSADRR